jgi:hypothetical protein
MRSPLTTLSLLVALIVLGAGCATSEEWQDWRGSHDPLRLGTTWDLLTAEQQGRLEPARIAYRRCRRADRELVGKGHHGQPGADLRVALIAISRPL